MIVRQLVAKLLETGGKRDGIRMNAAGDRTETLGTMIDRVHAGDDGEQHLRRADGAGRFLATDWLLPRLQRHGQRWSAVGIARHADDAARQLALEFVFCRKERGVRTAVPQGYAEPLRVAD